MAALIPDKSCVDFLIISKKATGYIMEQCCHQKADEDFFPECTDTIQFRKVFGFVFPAVRFEPGMAGYKARTLPLCYAVPPTDGDLLSMKMVILYLSMQFLPISTQAWQNLNEVQDQEEKKLYGFFLLDQETVFSLQSRF